MAIIQELGLFSWKDFQDDLQNLGDLERFKLVIETMPDQKLIKILRTLRNKGRNDHPIEAMWNSILAGIVFEHVSIESLRRELRRNAQFREMCGFNPLAYGIKAIIDIKNMWKDGERTRLLKNAKIKNVTYDYKGTVFCHCPKTGEIRPMSYGGFEAKRKALKYICPALALGIECKGATECPLFKKSIRIPLKEDRRIFTPVARSSYKWETLYDKRTSVLQSLLDFS